MMRSGLEASVVSYGSTVSALAADAQWVPRKHRKASYIRTHHGIVTTRFSSLKASAHRNCFAEASDGQKNVYDRAWPMTKQPGK